MLYETYCNNLIALQCLSLISPSPTEKISNIFSNGEMT